MARKSSTRPAVLGVAVLALVLPEPAVRLPHGITQDRYGNACLVDDGIGVLLTTDSGTGAASPAAPVSENPSEASSDGTPDP